MSQPKVLKVAVNKSTECSVQNKFVVWCILECIVNLMCCKICFISKKPTQIK